MANNKVTKPKKTDPRNYLDQLRKRGPYLSQRKVAQLIHMDIPTYNQIECGRQGKLMNAEKLYLLSKALNVDLNKLCLLEIKYQRDIRRLNGEEVEYDPEFDDVCV